MSFLNIIPIPTIIKITGHRSKNPLIIKRKLEYRFMSIRPRLLKIQASPISINTTPMTKFLFFIKNLLPPYFLILKV